MRSRIEGRDKMSWYDYIKKFYKTADTGELTSRKVYRNDFYTGPFLKIHAMVDNRKEEPVINVEDYGNVNSKNWILVPETREEFEIYKADLLKQIEEIDEKIQCLDENKMDRVDMKGFKIWKLVKQIKDEKDEAKLRQILSEATKD